MQRKSKYILGIIVLLSIFLVVYLAYPLLLKTGGVNQSRVVLGTYNLPEVQISGGMSVDQAIQSRRSVRSFSSTPLTLQDVSQLLWAAQGITDSERSYRSTPSAGHVFPMEVYLVASDSGVKDLEAGIYHYNPYNNTLEKIVEGDQTSSLSMAAHGQKWVDQADRKSVV